MNELPELQGAFRRVHRAANQPARRRLQSPTFSYECLTAAKAVRWARSPSPYCSTALSCVLAYVRWAFRGDRFNVDGKSVFFPSPPAMLDVMAEPMRHGLLRQ